MHAALGNLDDEFFPEMTMGARRAFAAAVKKVFFRFRSDNFCLRHALHQIERRFRGRLGVYGYRSREQNAEDCISPEGLAFVRSRIRIVLQVQS